MSEVRFSVVIPCRNDGERLASCLDAVAAQDRPALETIVVDGRSSDGTHALARAYGARILSDLGRGPAAARNVGIRAARGDVLAFTDADCVPRFDWLARLADVFEADPDVGGVAGALRLPRQTLVGRLEDNDARLSYDGYITSNVAYRRRVLEAVGGFDEALVCAEDYDLAWRVLDAGYRIERAPDAVVLHDPPEIDGGVRAYLLKQFWYARCDVPAHAIAIRRAWSLPGVQHGSRRAVAGLGSALANASVALGAGLSLAARSPILMGSVLVATGAAVGRHLARTLAEIGEGAEEALRMSAVEAAKRVVRGTGTLVGLAELARPSTLAAISRAGPVPWTAQRPLPALTP